MKKISEIKMEFVVAKEEELGELIQTYEGDERAGVVRLVEGAKRRLTLFQAELNRVREMTRIENELTDCEYICGVDEVGRGPLAGPVIAAAVILPKKLLIPYVNDSKKLSEKKREELAEIILEKALSVGFGSVDNQKIDEVNILNASLLSMRIAIENLSIKPDFVLVDGNKKIPKLTLPQRAIVKGDANSLSIAAASILAKVTRDRLMVEYAKTYPEYDFKSNKGYGSKKHYDGIRRVGLSPLHRRTFIHDVG